MDEVGSSTRSVVSACYSEGVAGEDPREVAEAEERARLRRARWTGGVTTHAGMTAVSAELWRAVSPDDRLGYVFDMWNEQSSLKDPSYEASPRLQRSVGGVRPRRG